MLEKALSGSRAYWAWIFGLLLVIGGGAACWIWQFSEGLTITGLSRDVTWGFYIAQFTFLVGVAASAVMVVLPYYLHNFKVFGTYAFDFGLQVGGNLYVRSGGGALVPLSSLVQLVEEGVASELGRQSQRRAIEIDVDVVQGVALQTAIDELLAAIRDEDLHLKYFLLTHAHPDHLIGVPAVRGR